jgi:hypothetical protein
MEEDFVSPFVRILPKKGYEEWILKLSKMAFLFHEAEYQMVKEGYRKAAVIHISQENLGAMLEKINKDKLVFTPILTSGYYQGFAHKHKPPKPGEPFFWYGSLTKTYEDGQRFKKAELERDHKTIGLLLGYPECCIRYFIKNFPINYDPIWIDKKGKVSGYPECNQMLRYFGARITSHLSCSPKCKETKKVGEKWIKVMEKIDKDLTKELYQILAGPMTWNSYHGVAQVETPQFIGLTHTFPILEKPRIIEWKGIGYKD